MVSASTGSVAASVIVAIFIIRPMNSPAVLVSRLHLAAALKEHGSVGFFCGLDVTLSDTRFNLETFSKMIALAKEVYSG